MVENIIGDIEQQHAIAVVAKPVAQEQVLAATILRQHLNSPSFSRDTLRELVAFLKEPLVGASVHSLRQALKTYNTSQDPSVLVTAVTDIKARQGTADVAPSPDSRKPLIRREDLNLVCYEYICA